MLIVKCGDERTTELILKCNDALSTKLIVKCGDERTTELILKCNDARTLKLSVKCGDERTTIPLVLLSDMFFCCESKTKNNLDGLWLRQNITRQQLCIQVAIPGTHMARSLQVAYQC